MNIYIVNVYFDYVIATLFSRFNSVATHVPIRIGHGPFAITHWFTSASDNLSYFRFHRFNKVVCLTSGLALFAMVLLCFAPITKQYALAIG